MGARDDYPALHNLSMYGPSTSQYDRALDELDRLRADGPYVLDEHDQTLYAEAFVMAQAVHRFLQRRSTQRVIDAGLLDDDVVRDLIASNDRMWSIRTQRVGAARRND